MRFGGECTAGAGTNEDRGGELDDEGDLGELRRRVYFEYLHSWNL